MAAVVRLSAFPSSTRFALSSLSSKFFSSSLSVTPSFSALPYHTSSPASLLSSPTSTNLSPSRFLSSSSSSPPSPPSDVDSSGTDIYNWSKHSGAELNVVVCRELKALCWRYLNQIDPAAVGVVGSGGSEGGEVTEQIGDSMIEDHHGILEDLMMKGNRKWDCLDTVEFLLDVENLFRITIPDEVADEIKSIQEVQDFVVKALTEQQQQQQQTSTSA
eukprot:GHVS01069814.1.p1 GENE.GHVS01069814.1~~GHVS01069814.1.p1  ORF type:complete len:236 (+),score=78.53 GHVS01069814.1:60-710(+)